VAEAGRSLRQISFSRFYGKKEIFNVEGHRTNVGELNIEN
jgi:hypothetical protein